MMSSKKLLAKFMQLVPSALPSMYKNSCTPIFIPKMSTLYSHFPLCVENSAFS